jgi:hypothetical protein
MSKSDRKKMKIYEYKFSKSSDQGRCISPKNVEREKFGDYISRKTDYHKVGGSPKTTKSKQFSPIFKRNTSPKEMGEAILQITLRKLKTPKRLQTTDIKQYTALSGKVLNFEIISE